MAHLYCAEEQQRVHAFPDDALNLALHSLVRAPRVQPLHVHADAVHVFALHQANSLGCESENARRYIIAM